MSKWYEKSGNDGDVAISTRVRLARNLRGFPFPNRLSKAQKEAVEEKIKDAVLNSNSYISSDFRYIPLDGMSQDEAVSLVERHLVSPEFISDLSGRGILLNSDESISIMMNEEDHIRIQVMKEGLDLTEAFEIADRIDTLINENVDIAFHPELGYLTQCPTNLGTGMRASVMLHLPALQDSGAIPRLTASLAKLGIIIRGTYGEGSDVVGALYQLSNQITLGLSEGEAINNLTSIANQLIGEERKARAALAQNLSVQDKISRATGVLKSAKMMSYNEYMDLISSVRFGLAMNIITGITQDEINKLTVMVQPATLGCGLDVQERDLKRARIIREAMKHVI